jgi:hypothetical protein
MGGSGSYVDRARRLLASPRVLEKKPPRAVSWPIAHAEPADLAALYQLCDGVLLDDGVRVFGRGELGDVTQWLLLEKGLGWPDDLVVVGERRDAVIVLDLDVRNERAGGGVLEVGADDLGAFDRVASGVLSYLLVRAGAGEDEMAPPEVTARRAAALGDRVALERELARARYPGQDRAFASLLLELGALHAAAGDADRALAAFARSVEARAASVTRDACDAERAAGWRGAAIASRARHAEAVALECEQRARR